MVSTRSFALLGQASPAFRTLDGVANIRSSSSHSLHLVPTRKSPTCKLPPARHLPEYPNHISVTEPFSNPEGAAEEYTDPCEVRMSGFDMKIGKIEHNSVREISEATVVDDQSLASVDHLIEVRVDFQSERDKDSRGG